MAKIVCVLLQRRDINVPWGFRLTGGKDLDRPLIIHKVSPDTLASQQLAPGDVVLALQGQPAETLTNADAICLIRAARLNLEITLHKPPPSLASLLNASPRRRTSSTSMSESPKPEHERRSSFSGTLVHGSIHKPVPRIHRIAENTQESVYNEILTAPQSFYDDKSQRTFSLPDLVPQSGMIAQERPTSPLPPSIWSDTDLRGWWQEAAKRATEKLRRFLRKQLWDAAIEENKPI